jgi:hypothetical protein
MNILRQQLNNEVKNRQENIDLILNKTTGSTIDLLITIKAKALLWNQEQIKASSVHKVVNEDDYTTIIDKIHEFAIPLQFINIWFGKMLLDKPTLTWNNDKLKIIIPVTVKRTEDKVKKLLRGLDMYIHAFHQGACDGYLCGDGTIYKTDNDVYEYVLDHIKVKIKYNNQTIKKTKYLNYWNR